MSQFIQLPKNFPLQAPVILKGVLSKVVEPSLKNSPRRSFSQQRLSHKQFNKFFDSTMDSRYVQEVKKADDLQNVIIDFQYKRMKKKLLNYGKSAHHRVQRIVRDGPKQKYFDSLQSQRHIPSLKQSRSHKNSSPLKLVQQIQHEHKQAKLRYSIGKIHSQIDSHDRTVFVDRKYNNQFVVKFSALKQAQEVKEMKQKYKQFLSSINQRNPLVNQAKRSIERKKYHTQYEKESLEAIGVIKINNTQTKNFYQSRKKQRSLHNVLIKKEKNQSTKKHLFAHICKNKQTKALSCDIKNKQNQHQIMKKSDKQNQVKYQTQQNVQNKPINIRKRQRKITWEKQSKKV